MTRAGLYIRPLALRDSPEDGAERLAGGMVWASRFALLIREEGEIIERRVVAAPDLAEALTCLPDAFTEEGEAQWSALRQPRPPLALGNTTVPLDQPQVMGVLNLTPDSFSDGGVFLDDPDAAHAHALAMLEAGAAIIDVGGESTRPGAVAVREEQELARVVPAIERLAGSGAAISVDTRRAVVMAAALAAGAHVINDVSALRHDPRSLALAAKSGATVVLMHAPGSGDDLHDGAAYRDIVFDVFDFLRERRDAAIAGGIPRNRIVLDPGIGFGKSLADNLALMNALTMFHALGQPLLVGASRKRMIGALSMGEAATRRLGGSLTLALHAMNAGVQLIRVHDVHETVQAAAVWRALREAALTGPDR
ncbi:MAG: dihydropteroate synthase [Novosphingobium sp.]